MRYVGESALVYLSTYLSDYLSVYQLPVGGLLSPYMGNPFPNYRTPTWTTTKSLSSHHQQHHIILIIGPVLSEVGQRCLDTSLGGVTATTSNLLLSSVSFCNFSSCHSFFVESKGKMGVLFEKKLLTKLIRK